MEEILIGCKRRIILIGFCLLLLSCSRDPNTAPVPSGVEMIFWEDQSWEMGGGTSRLTLWVDGRSEVTVVPNASFRHSQAKIQPREGWIMKQGANGRYFVRPSVFPGEVAKEKFTAALEAGIHLLKTFQPQYVDGGGTLVGVQIKGKLKETVIPMFDDSKKGTLNHKRFLAVAQILSDFERQPFDLPD